MEAEHNGVTLADVLEALDNNDAEKGGRLLRRWMSDEPKPCPCCGGAPFIGVRGLHSLIVCEDCGMSTQSGEFEDVLRVWNNRVDKTE